MLRRRLPQVSPPPPPLGSSPAASFAHPHSSLSGKDGLLSYSRAALCTALPMLTVRDAHFVTTTEGQRGKRLYTHVPPARDVYRVRARQALGRGGVRKSHAANFTRDAVVRRLRAFYPLPPSSPLHPLALELATRLEFISIRACIPRYDSRFRTTAVSFYARKYTSRGYCQIKSPERNVVRTRSSLGDFPAG